MSSSVRWVYGLAVYLTKRKDVSLKNRKLESELTRKGEAIPCSRWCCAIDENASGTPAAVDINNVFSNEKS